MQGNQYIKCSLCVSDGPLSGNGGMSGQRILGPNNMGGTNDPFASLTNQTPGMRPGMVQAGIRQPMQGQTSIGQNVSTFVCE